MTSRLIRVEEMLARLDPQRPNAPYSEMEAREAFRRVAQQHGWKV